MLFIDGDPVLVDVVLMGVVQVPVVQVVGVPVVSNRRVSAGRAVLVVVQGMDGMLGLGHVGSFFVREVDDATVGPTSLAAKQPVTRTILSSLSTGLTGS